VQDSLVLAMLTKHHYIDYSFYFSKKKFSSLHGIKPFKSISSGSATPTLVAEEAFEF
jgi:hypothetical protein